MKVIIKTRLGWAHLWEAVDFKGDQVYNYDAKFMVEAGSEADKTIKAAIQTVAEERWKDKAKAMLASFGGNKMQNCYVDGAIDGYDNTMVLTSKRKQDQGRPDVRDRDTTPLTEKDGKPYSGCYVVGVVDIWAQDGNGYKGIRCQLLGIQFVKDGPAFSQSKKAADDDFADLGVLEEDEMFS